MLFKGLGVQKDTQAPCWLYDHACDTFENNCTHVNIYKIFEGEIVACIMINISTSNTYLFQYTVVESLDLTGATGMNH